MNGQPSTIHRYEIERRIGEGGMGSLYLARDPILDRQVAIKVLREGFDNPDLRERFVREAKSAARLTHVNIVRIFDFGEHEGQPYIAMEYIPGETLEDKRKLAESDRRICPMLAGFENLPPIDIIYGTADGLCPQIELAIPLMRRAGCSVETKVFEGQPHGFLVAVGLPAEKEAAEYIVSRLQ